MHWIEKVDLQEVAISNVVPKERHPFDQTDVRNEGRTPGIVVRYSSLGYSEGVVNLMTKCSNIMLDVVVLERVFIADEEVRKHTVDVSANLLTSLCGAKDTNDGDRRQVGTLCR